MMLDIGARLTHCGQMNSCAPSARFVLPRWPAETIPGHSDYIHLWAHQQTNPDPTNKQNSMWKLFTLSIPSKIRTIKQQKTHTKPVHTTVRKFQGDAWCGFDNLLPLWTKQSMTGAFKTGVTFASFACAGQWTPASWLAHVSPSFDPTLS